MGPGFKSILCLSFLKVLEVLGHLQLSLIVISVLFKSKSGHFMIRFFNSWSGFYLGGGGQDFLHRIVFSSRGNNLSPR